MSLLNKRVVIIGGSLGIGLATAKAAQNAGAEVIIASRSKQKLDNAKTKLGKNIIAYYVDINIISTLETLFKQVGHFDHLQLPGSEFTPGPFLTISLKNAKQSFENKFWGPFVAARCAHSYLNVEGASITFFSGAYSQRPAPGSAVIAAINSAIEGLVRALAIELNPIRVNAISPGLTITEKFTEKYTPEALNQLCSDFCKQLPLKRPAKPEEIAQTALYLMTNTYTTGNTLFVDGGLTLR